jgi:N-hydroxyarylamine O-acetyltransferase
VLERLEAGRRHKIVNRRYWTETRDGIVDSERRIDSGADLRTLLEEIFGVTPPAPAEEIYAGASG